MHLTVSLIMPVQATHLSDGNIFTELSSAHLLSSRLTFDPKGMFQVVLCV